MYGREFIKNLSDAELGFVVAHEGYHKMYRHLTTWRRLHEEDARLTNMACDYVINLQLRDLDPQGTTVSMPKYRDGKMKGHDMGLWDERFRGMNTKQVFDILKQEKQEGGGGGGIDEHDWDGAKDMTAEEKKELEREVDQAIRQGVMAQQKAGTGAGGLDRELQDLMTPKINWREVLREFVKATCNAKDTSSWRRVNRRFLSGDVYMPSMIGEKVGHLVIGIDTSGSIGGKQLTDFLSEVKGIAEEVSPEIVDLIYWDSEVAAHEEYTGNTVGSIIESTKPRGGGGTSPSCVSEYLKTKNIKPECTIILTDGYVGDDWGSEWTSEVLWCIVGGNDVVAPNGKTVHVSD
jgi:predicted metal-dependent peptidase